MNKSHSVTFVGLYEFFLNFFFRISLIDYVLDFGHVIINSVASQVCQLTNAGQFSVSLMTDQKHLLKTGFYVDLDRVKGLPGAPDNETIEFQVVFNPTAPNVSLGPVETVLPIKVCVYVSHCQRSQILTLCKNLRKI